MGEWVLFGAVCLFWLIHLARPFASRPVTPGVDERVRLAEAKRGLLYALRDAEIDFESGKLTEEDYGSIRSRLEAEAEETIRLLDALGGGTPEQRVAGALERLRRSIALAFTAGALAASGAGAAALEGRVLDGSTPGGIVAGHDVRLTAQLASGDRVDRTIRSGPAGGFAFAELPGDTADVYVLSTAYDGVDYVSRFIRFPMGADVVEADLLVYRATTADSLLHLDARHLVIEIAENADHVLVTEVLAFGNSGNETIVPRAPLRLAVPEAARDAEGLEGFAGAALDAGETGALLLELEGSVRPGTFRYEGAVRYHLPARFPLRVHVRGSLPTEEVTVLVAPAGTVIEGENLDPLGIIDLGDGLVSDRYGVPLEDLRGAFGFTIQGPARRAGGSPRAWLIVGAILAAFAALLLQRGREGSEAGGASGAAAAERSRLQRKRDAFLMEILALEANGAGEAGPITAARDKLLVKATAVQELIDELTERDA